MRNRVALFAALALFPLTAVMARQTAAPQAAPSARAPRSKAAAASAAAARTAAGMLDINTASKQELGKLNGIGPAYAERIIKGRPYARKDQLLIKRILPKKVYDAIKNRIIAKP